MTTTSPSLPHRTDLNSLPFAVKTHIARLCTKADQSLSTTKARLRKTAAAEFTNALADLDRRRDGSSVGNLFCVSKEWSAIAAPFRFEKLNLKQFRSAIFAMRIVHLRGQHFKDVNLVDARLPDLVQFLGLLPLMPNIITLASSDFHVAADSRAPYIEMDPPEVACLENGMKKLFERVDHISLHIRTVNVLPDLLSTSARGRLQRLSLHLAKPTGFSAFLKSLLDLRNLNRLDLDFAGVSRTLDTELTTLVASAATAGELPQLRQLIICSPDVSPAVLDFVSLFAPSLFRLALIFSSYRLAFVPQTPQGSAVLNGPFPHLKQLILEGDANALEGPLGSVTDTNMPSLQRLIYTPQDLPAGIDRRAAESSIPTPHRLAPLDYIGIHPTKAVASTVDLKSLPLAQLPTKQLCLEEATYRGLLSYSRTFAPPVAPDFEVADRKVQTTLDFLRRWRVSATVWKDAASLVKMARALCDVELERIAHEA